MSNTVDLSQYQAYQRLINVGLAMSAEKELSSLLKLILLEAKDMTRSDGGTIYLNTGEGSLEFAIMINDSLDIHRTATEDATIDLPEVPLSKNSGEMNLSNVAAASANLGRTIVIEDVYLDREYDFQGTRIFDEMLDYRSCSFLTVSLKNFAGECIGVLQLLNSRTPDGDVTQYDLKRVPLVESLASLASVAIENRKLLDAEQTRKRLLEQKVEAKGMELEGALAELSETKKDLEALDTLDRVTGLKNRRYFDEVVQLEWRRARRQDYEISIALFYIDDLKNITQKYENDFRHTCLIAIAGEVESNFQRPSDFIADFGDGTFAALLPYLSSHETSTLCEQLRSTVEKKSFVAKGERVKITISTGIATLPTNVTLEASQLVETAEKALHQAKLVGGNCVQSRVE